MAKPLPEGKRRAIIETLRHEPDLLPGQVAYRHAVSHNTVRRIIKEYDLDPEWSMKRVTTMPW